MRPIIYILSLLICSFTVDNGNIRSSLDTSTISQNQSETIKIRPSEPQIDSISLTIKPGKGIDNLYLGTTNEDSTLEFKNLKFSFSSGEGIACGEAYSCINFWKRYSHDTSGLLLVYSSDCFPELNIPDTYSQPLVRITVTGNKGATLENGLRLGTSTYSNVAKIYGPIPKEWKNESYLNFRKKGIAFRFDDSSIISEIEVFTAEK
jgi:hypothetical protein